MRVMAGGSVAWGGLFAAFPLGTVHRRSGKKDLDLVHRSLAPWRAYGWSASDRPLDAQGQRRPEKRKELVPQTELRYSGGSEARFWHQWPGGKQGNSFPHAFAAAARVGWMDGLLQAWEAYLTNTPLGWRVTAITLRSDPKCRMFSNGMVLGCGNTGLASCPGFAVLQALRRTWEVQPLPRRCCCRPLAGCWRQGLRGPGSSWPGLPIPATA